MSGIGEKHLNFSEEERIRFWNEMEKRAEARREPKGDLHVVFSVGGGRFALPADVCTGVSPFSLPTPIPFISRHLLGVVFVKGKIISVTDVCSLIGARQENPWGFLVMIRAGKTETALAVESVEGVTPVEGDKLVPAHSAWPGARIGLVKGRARESVPTVYVLDPERCIQQSLS